MFLIIVTAFIIGLLLGFCLRGAKSTNQGVGSHTDYKKKPPDLDFNEREFIGFPISPAMKKFNRESEISTALTAEFMRNQNMRRALQIKEERQDLVDQSRLF